MKIVLASGSPRRRRLLEKIGIHPEIVVSNALESNDISSGPESLVKHNAYIKAKTVFKKLGRGPVLGSDTIVVLDGKLLGKPSSQAEAYRMIECLSGRSHEVYTGVAILDKNKELIDCDRAVVNFKKLTDKMVDEYFALINPMDKAGAYAAQNEGKMVIESIEGDETTVIGLPMNLLRRMLKNF